MLSVRYLITKVVVGGAQETVLASSRALQKERTVSVITGPDGLDGPNLADEIRATGASLVVLDTLRRSVLPFLDLRTLFRLRKLLKHDRDYVLHTHSSKAGVLGRIAAWRLGHPVVHTVHGWSFNDNMASWVRWLIIRLERSLARITDNIVVVCETDREIGLTARIGTVKQYVVIPSAIELALFTEAKSNRTQLGLREDRNIVGFVGRLSEQKNPLAFIGAAELVCTQQLDVDFVLVGDGPLTEGVLERVANSSFANRITVLPSRRDVADTIASLDAIVLCSRFEGLPRILLESQAVGTPVIAVDVGGISEAITNNETGLLLSSSEPSLIAEKITDLLGDDQLSALIASNARESVKAYDVSVMVDGLRKLYATFEPGVPS